MSAETLAEWLRCPVCAEALTMAAATVVGCLNGHRFDVNKRGYVTLLGPRSRVVGDTAEMLDARTRVLERGTYAPIAEAILEIIPASTGTTSPPRVVDAGAGTGYYLRSVLAARPGARGLALDLSPAAVGRAARSADQIDGLVADTWQPLPIRTGVANIILNVFAPRNLAEFHRILIPDGVLVVVVPRAEHLQELRRDGRMLDVPADKAESLIESTTGSFTIAARTEVVFDVPYDEVLAESLVAMGPSAHHRPATSTETVNPTTVTAAVDVLAFTPLQQPNDP